MKNTKITLTAIAIIALITTGYTAGKILADTPREQLEKEYTEVAQDYNKALDMKTRNDNILRLAQENTVFANEKLSEYETKLENVTQRLRLQKEKEGLDKSQ